MKVELLAVALFGKFLRRASSAPCAASQHLTVGFRKEELLSIVQATSMEQLQGEERTELGLFGKSQQQEISVSFITSACLTADTH
jgi:hypothetical protein